MALWEQRFSVNLFAESGWWAYTPSAHMLLLGFVGHARGPGSEPFRQMESALPLLASPVL